MWFALRIFTEDWETTDIESIYGAWCMEGLIMRGSGRFYDLGTENLAAIGMAHYHRPSVNPRMYFNTLTGGAARDVGGSGELVVHRRSRDRQMKSRVLLAN